MKQFIDFIPLILFFIVFKFEPRDLQFLGQPFEFGGIYSATAVLIGSSILVYGSLLIRQGKLDKGQWLTLLACLIFGSMTLIFHSETFLKWKAPVVNWLFALGFAGSHFIGDKPLVQRIGEPIIDLTPALWARLNIIWALYFVVCGFTQLFVAFTFPSIWVDFKVFGSLGMTLVFMICQAPFLVRHLREPQSEENPKD